MSRYGTVEPSSTTARPRSASRSATPSGQWPVGENPTQAPRSATRQRGIAAWPIRRKLSALVAVPMTAILIGSGAVIGATLSDLRDARQAREIAAAGIVVNEMSRAVLEERTAAIANLGDASTEQTKTAVKDALAATDKVAAALDATLDDGPVRGWSEEVRDKTVTTREALSHLDDIRTAAGSQGRSMDELMANYAVELTALQELTKALNRELEEQTAGSRTSDGAATLSALTAAAVAASEERDILYSALLQNNPDVNSLSEPEYARLALLAAIQLQQLDSTIGTARGDQAADIMRLRVADNVLDRFRRDATYLLPEAGDDGTPGDAKAFAKLSQARINQLQEVINRFAEETREEAAAAENSAWIRAVLAGTGALLVLLFVIAATAAIGRTITDPLRRLRSGAVDISMARLPSAVRQIESEGPDAEIHVAPVLPIGTKAGPETIEVAAAVDGLTATAIRLASAQTNLRRTLDQAFVNMSRRSQTMVEKQLGIIDELESTEQDPDQLRNLFRLDHLAARMRRYNDNLLVLAGSAVRTRSSAPVPVSELFRAATSEMEQYERVRLAPVAGASVVGSAAGGLVHLIAELLDNAAMYSPPTSPIVLSAAFDPDRGLVIEIQDSGVGIPAVELQRINARLAETENQDLSIPSRMGLFVVGRLASRGNFRVWLRQRQGAPGTVAEVGVPSNLVIGGPGSTGEISPVPSSLQAIGFGTPPPAAHTGSLPALNAPRSPMPVVPMTGVGVGAPNAPAASARPPAAAPVTRDTTGGSVTPAADDQSSPLPRRPLQQRPGQDVVAAAAAAAAQTPAAPGTMFGGGDDPTALPATVARDADPLSTATWRIAETPSPLPSRSNQRGDVVAAATAAAAAAPPIINLAPPTESTGRAPQAWDGALPAELATRATPAPASDPTLIGEPPSDDDDDTFSTPIFNSISAWFEDEEDGDVETTDAAPEVATETEGKQGSGRWAALGDQRWIAANARAAAAPTTAGQTEQGLPLRRPGANLIPTAASTVGPRARSSAVRPGPQRVAAPAAAPAAPAGQGLPFGPPPPGSPFGPPLGSSAPSPAPVASGGPSQVSPSNPFGLPAPGSAGAAHNGTSPDGVPIRGAAAAFTRRGETGLPIRPGRDGSPGPSTGSIPMAHLAPQARPLPGAGPSSGPGQLPVRGAAPAPAAGPPAGLHAGPRPGQAPGYPAPSGAPAARAATGRLTSPPPVNSAGVSADAEAVRGRLGSYQRGLSSARQARRQAVANGDNGHRAGSISTAPPEGSTDASASSADQGGDQ